MSNVIRFPANRPRVLETSFIGVIAGSNVIDAATGPLLEVRFVTALNAIDPDQRRLLPKMLESGNFTLITLEQET